MRVKKSVTTVAERDAVQEIEPRGHLSTPEDVGGMEPLALRIMLFPAPPAGKAIPGADAEAPEHVKAVAFHVGRWARMAVAVNKAVQFRAWLSSPPQLHAPR